MAIYSRKNQYVGVNAHLHSVLQNEHGSWPVFHSAHVIHLSEAIDRKLPPGYVVAPEQSLQIREFDADTGLPFEQRARSMRPDIVVYEYESPAALHSPVSAPAVTAPTLTLTPAASINPENYYRAVLIYEFAEGRMGKLVTRIELLLPSNKPPESGYGQYREKRGMALVSGVVMVEIDYLHQSRPVDERIPSYPDGHPDAYPYSIIVTDPRPTLEQGMERFYGFRVDAPMPVIDIPLSGGKAVNINFGEVYHQTYGSLSVYSRQVDYEQEPLRFDTYQAVDQERIRARMQAVIEAQARGESPG